MPSDFVTYTDAVISDLQGAVSALSAANATTHRYVPYNPEELQVSAGERHLAVWPMGEAEVADPLANWTLELVAAYAVLVWEDASEESSRGVLDEDATKTFLQLHQDVRARFLLQANESIGGSELTRYVGTRFPEALGSVRWFLVQLAVYTPKAIT